MKKRKQDGRKEIRKKELKKMATIIGVSKDKAVS
jgi:hypothetical protein